MFDFCISLFFFRSLKQVRIISNYIIFLLNTSSRSVIHSHGFIHKDHPNQPSSTWSSDLIYVSQSCGCRIKNSFKSTLGVEIIPSIPLTFKEPFSQSQVKLTWVRFWFDRGPSSHLKKNTFFFLMNFCQVMSLSHQ